MEVVGSVTPSCLPTSARRWRRRMDQDEEQVVGIPHDADLERVGTRGQIEGLSACRDERSAGFDERRNRRVNVRDAQLDPCGARVLDPRKLRLPLYTLEVDQRELQACRGHLELADAVLPAAQPKRVQDGRVATALSQAGRVAKRA